MPVSYEWCLETIEDDEVVDLNFSDRLIDLGFGVVPSEVLVLVRTTDNGDRSWAYTDESRMLPKFFSIPERDGIYYEINVKVPQRFHREIARVACGGR